MIYLNVTYPDSPSYLLKMNYLKSLQKRFSSNSFFGNPYRIKTSKSATKKNGSSSRYR